MLTIEKVIGAIQSYKQLQGWVQKGDVFLPAQNAKVLAKCISEEHLFDCQFSYYSTGCACVIRPYAYS